MHSSLRASTLSFLNCLRTSSSFCICSSRVFAAISTSSTNHFIPSIPCKIVSMVVHWNTAGAEAIPNGNLKYIYNPRCVFIVTKCREVSFRINCRYCICKVKFSPPSKYELGYVKRGSTAFKVQKDGCGVPSAARALLGPEGLSMW